MGQETQDPKTQFLEAVQTFSKLEYLVARGTLVTHYFHQQEDRLVFNLFYCFYEPSFFDFKAHRILIHVNVVLR